MQEKPELACEWALIATVLLMVMRFSSHLSDPKHEHTI
jgi:hypothetical protein